MALTTFEVINLSFNVDIFMATLVTLLFEVHNFRSG